MIKEEKEDASVLLRDLAQHHRHFAHLRVGRAVDRREDEVEVSVDVQGKSDFTGSAQVMFLDLYPSPHNECLGREHGALLSPTLGELTTAYQNGDLHRFTPWTGV